MKINKFSRIKTIGFWKLQKQKFSGDSTELRKVHLKLKG